MAADDILDYETLFSSTPAALLVIARDRTIEACNACFREMLGKARYGTGDVVGRKLLDAVPVEGAMAERLSETLDGVFATGASASLLLHLRRAGDGERVWRCNAVAVPGGDGTPAFVTLHAQDVTTAADRSRDDRPRGGSEGAPARTAGQRDALASSLLGHAERDEARDALLLAESGELRGLFMRAPSFMCLLRGADYRIELANGAFADLVGRQDLVGRTFREAVPEVDGQLYVDLLDRVYRSGEAFVGKRMRAEFERVAGQGPEEVFISFVFQPILDAAGGVVGIFIDGNDVTDHVRAEKAQALLVRELHHRVRNTLATVQGVMNSTARTAETIEDYQWAFSGRISSLARTHSLLTEEIQQFVSLPHLLRQEIGAYADGDDRRVVLEGPDVELPSQLAVPLGMTIHELSTNAYRHGALSVPDGRVMVSWTVTPAREKRVLACRWVETGGPPVSPPARQGFGSMMLARVLKQQIGAKVDASYPPGGFELHASIPLMLERV